MRDLLLGGLAALSAMVLAAGAEAHGPPRKKVEERVDINAPPEKVWGVLSNFHDMSWLPPVEKTEGPGGNAVDATRRLTLTGGATVDEVLHKYEPETMSYSYRITAVDVKVLPVTNYASTIAVEPGTGGKSVVVWRGAFYRGYPNNDPPPELNDDAAIKAVTGLYRMGLDALKAKIERSGS
ncbi:SRPBCC family protein [Enterovirga sp. CN4-39]|uniref:SRPBCC family protein n=1 Tax=Enterovirga sp. CN4-39 TaxID=3400910 RepID=UPI003C0EA521